MGLDVQIETSFFSAKEEESFKRIITTAIGSRVMRPHFGSRLYELVDRSMDEEFRMLFSKYLLECFYDENFEPWDERLIPKRVKILNVDTTKGSMESSIEFENRNIEFSLGGF